MTMFALSAPVSRYAALGWAAFIVLLLSLPGNSVPRFSFHLIGIPSDAIVHAVLFCIQALLLGRAFASGGLPAPFTPVSRFSAMMLASCTSIMYGAVTELWQHVIPGRSGDVMDLVADAAGAGLAFLLMIAMNRRERHPDRSVSSYP